MSEVFLSYSHHDKAQAERLCRVIERRRAVFMDRRRLAPGAKWETALQDALRAARCVVVLWSQASVQSEWVQREAREGMVRNILVPVRIDNVPIPTEFQELHTADLMDWEGAESDALRFLIARIDEVLRLPPGTPDIIADEWEGLVAGLDAAVPVKATGENLLLATWNVRSLGALTNSWTATAHDSPKRDRRAAIAIAEIVSRFDIVMLTEVKGPVEALMTVREFLGEEWSVIFSDVGAGPAGAGERPAFLFDTRRVLPAGLADHVMPGEGLAPDGVLLSDPMYAVTFRTKSPSAPLELTCIVLHLFYGSSWDVDPGIQAALRALGDWLEDWSEKHRDAGRALLALGDFNLDRTGTLAYDAVVSRLVMPREMHGFPRTIFASGPGESDSSNFYDQVAWFGGDQEGPSTALRYRSCGTFDFVGAVHADLSTTELTWRISDHYPLWIEFSTPSAAGSRDS